MPVLWRVDAAGDGEGRGLTAHHQPGALVRLRVVRGGVPVRRVEVACRDVDEEAVGRPKSALGSSGASSAGESAPGKATQLAASL
jgi:hypothetical protein